MRLYEFRDRRVLGSHAQRRARQADLAQTRAKYALTHDERRPARCATLLSVIVREQHPLVRDAIYVGRPIAHHSLGEAAEIRLADIIAPDDQNVRFLFRRWISLCHWSSFCFSFADVWLFYLTHMVENRPSGIP